MYNFQDSNGLHFMFIPGLEKDTLAQIVWDLQNNII